MRSSNYLHRSCSKNSLGPVENMEPLGILLYGYNLEHSNSIKTSLDAALDQDIIVISASNKEQSKVSEILNQPPEACFEDKETKILMFLGFSDEQIGAVLKAFPQDEGLKRPIFCGLTEQNINWSMNALIEHLLEEQRYWSQKAQER